LIIPNWVDCNGVNGNVLRAATPIRWAESTLPAASHVNLRRRHECAEKTIPLSFGMIVSTGVLPQAVLDGVYDFAHEIVIVEGADAISQAIRKCGWFPAPIAPGNSPELS